MAVKVLGAEPAAFLVRAREAPLSAKVIAALALALLPLGTLAYASVSASYAELQHGRERLLDARFGLLRQTAAIRLGRVFADIDELAGREAGGADDNLLCGLLRSRAAQPGVAALVSLDSSGSVRCVVGKGLPLPAIVRLARALPGMTAARFATVVLPDPNGDGIWLASRDVGARALGGAVAARLAPRDLERFIDRAALTPRDEVRLEVAGQSVAKASILAWSDGPSRVRLLTRRGAIDPENNVMLELTAPLPDVRARQALGVALPALMWLTALCIAWIMLNRLVVRPVNEMRAVVDRYSSGEHGARIDSTKFGSRELAGLANAFDGMANHIAEQGQAAQAALVTEKALTREVHHRVKNNLQIVSSLISIQARDAANSEVADAYALIRSRVNALALVHRWMYQDGGGQGVDLRSLAADLCANLEHGSEARPGGRIHVSCAVGPLILDQDTALPIAFLITELVSGTARAPGRVDARVEARTIDGRAMLCVASDAFGDENGFAHFEDASKRIVAGLARQMRSPLNYDVVAHAFTIQFPVLRAD